jgi:NAD(P)-dependent dehydrogenase (short-subunit alcohol dehydrogenase family)
MKRKHRHDFNKTLNGMKKLENKTAFITGGLSGIGRACAFAAIKEVASIAVADPKPENIM